MRENHQSSDPYAELAAAICGQAAEDYRNARAEGRRADMAQQECRNFFQSDAVELLCGGNGPEILAMLDREPVGAASPAGVSKASRRVKESVLTILADAASAVAEAEIALGTDAPQRLKATAEKLSGLRDVAEKIKATYNPQKNDR